MWDAHTHAPPSSFSCQPIALLSSILRLPPTPPFSLDRSATPSLSARCIPHHHHHQPPFSLFHLAHSQCADRLHGASSLGRTPPPLFCASLPSRRGVAAALAYFPLSFRPPLPSPPMTTIHRPLRSIWRPLSLVESPRIAVSRKRTHYFFSPIAGSSPRIYCVLLASSPLCTSKTPLRGDSTKGTTETPARQQPAPLPYRVLRECERRPMRGLQRCVEAPAEHGVANNAAAIHAPSPPPCTLSLFSISFSSTSSLLSRPVACTRRAPATQDRTRRCRPPHTRGSHHGPDQSRRCRA